MRFLTAFAFCLFLTSTGLSEETFDFNDGTNGGLTEYSLAQSLPPVGIDATYTT